MSAIRWTHPSVVKLIEEAGARDPYAAIESRARELALQGLEEGWEGPPYDPFALADILGIAVVGRDDLEDARLVPDRDDRVKIEFNPNRRKARVRFSVAHELGHWLFSDHREQVRYRNQAHDEPRRADDWQLEVLCNVAAAEILMPAGAFPMAEAENLSLAHLLDLRAVFGVSTEALLRRVVKLTSKPACLFAASRLSRDRGFRIDYVVGSRAWGNGLRSGDRIGADSLLARCTAVGFSDEGIEDWGERELLVQAVGIPPYPGDRFPRLAGILQPADESATVATAGLRYVRGSAAQPRADGPVIIAHIANNQAQRWGGRGFVLSLLDEFPASGREYQEWATSRANRQLGAVHIAEAGDGIWIASLVAQAGYGPAEGGKPRLRLSALRSALEKLAALASEHEASVHMPPIGTGQGGMSWPPIRDLILEELVARGIDVTVYVLPDARMPDDGPNDTQLALV